MHSCVTSKNVKWCHLIRPTLYFRCRAKDCGISCAKPITTKQQSVFWLVSQSRHMLAIFVGSCRWLSLAATNGDPCYLPLPACRLLPTTAGLQIPTQISKFYTAQSNVEGSLSEKPFMTNKINSSDIINFIIYFSMFNFIRKLS